MPLKTPPSCWSRINAAEDAAILLVSDQCRWRRRHLAGLGSTLLKTPPSCWSRTQANIRRSLARCESPPLWSRCACCSHQGHACEPATRKRNSPVTNWLCNTKLTYYYNDAVRVCTCVRACAYACPKLNSCGDLPSNQGTAKRHMHPILRQPSITKRSGPLSRFLPETTPSIKMKMCLDGSCTMWHVVHIANFTLQQINQTCISSPMPC